jgi:hypothetical protein
MGRYEGQEKARMGGLGCTGSGRNVSELHLWIFGQDLGAMVGWRLRGSVHERMEGPTTAAWVGPGHGRMERARVSTNVEWNICMRTFRDGIYASGLVRRVKGTEAGRERGRVEGPSTRSQPWGMGGKGPSVGDVIA